MNSLFLTSPNASSFHSKNVGTFGRKLSSFCPLTHMLLPKLPNLQLKKHRSRQPTFEPPYWEEAKHHERIKNRDRIRHIEKKRIKYEKSVYFELKMFCFLLLLPGVKSLRPPRQQINFIIRHTGLL